MPEPQNPTPVRHLHSDLAARFPERKLVGKVVIAVLRAELGAR
jgi:hypothetical protein